MQQISSCCNEIYVCNNLNILYTVYIHSLWPAIVYKKEEALALCVTTFAHPYSLFTFVVISIFILLPCKKSVGDPILRTQLPQPSCGDKKVGIFYFGCLVL